VIEVPVGAEWSEVFFVLEGPADERVRVEVSQADRTEQVEAVVVQDYFGVTQTVIAQPPASGPRSERPPPPASAVVTRAADWQDAIEDEQFRAVFVHIEQHRSINES
jgi:hypothetical protein